MRVGWYCVYTPEEIIAAAGCEPYRLVPPDGIEGNTPLLPSTLCPLVRCLVTGLEQGAFPPLNGVIIVNSCHAMLHLYNALAHRFTEEPFVFLLDMPRRDGPAATTRLAAELRVLAAFLGTRSGRSVTTERLWATIREQGNALLAAEGPGAPGVRGMRKAGPRVALAGSLPPPGLAALVEEAGGAVVTDDLCGGRRYRSGRGAVLEEALAAERDGEDPFAVLARSHLRRSPPCPRFVTRGDGRRRELLKLVETHDLRGLIYHTLKFCDLSHYDYLWVREALREKGVPVLHLETELGTRDLGRLRTRVEAFLEMLL
ncbi:MAG: 2-hydroxyacyl-CoA dehydratase family protein [Thermoanaerobacterales bacterium]|nr:2-hydroxyacyl-CoA dehydratase family protein [Bacillota bacterium]MDI6905875.1 2-hydroxyacyl-CoA dehydratase family protein [Thermoanaerobacterales bacterium]